MGSFKEKFAHAAACSALALSVGLSAGMPAVSMAGETPTAPSAKAADAQVPLVTEYKGPDTVAGLMSEISRLSKDKALFVMFYVEWCGASCENMTRSFVAAKDKTQLPFGVLRVPVSAGKDKNTAVNANERIAEVFGIQNIPDVRITLDGRQVGHFVGVMPLEVLVDNMNKMHRKMQEKKAGSESPVPAP